MSQGDTVVHLIAGGVGGTAGAIATCPLEVVKTRLQSTVATFHNHVPSIRSAAPPESWVEFSTCYRPSELLVLSHADIPPQKPERLGIWSCLRYIVKNEGANALFKGLGPNLIGVAPSRAIYFCAYSRAKSFFNEFLTPDTAGVHMFSAMCAGFTTSTVTNPIWLVKTRLQLDQRKNGSLSVQECVQRIYRTNGLSGFYKGLTASYAGISETVIHFVIYEAIKAKLRQYRNGSCYDEKTSRDFLEYMAAGAFSKTCASCVAYPHEVARTRLREEGSKYRRFWHTLATILQEEGCRGLYRGLTTQLVRQIPNTALMMSTYELVIYLFSNSTPRVLPDLSTVDSGHTHFITVDNDIK